jgi:hypothetical protein
MPEKLASTPVNGKWWGKGTDSVATLNAMATFTQQMTASMLNLVNAVAEAKGIAVKSIIEPRMKD